MTWYRTVEVDGLKIFYREAGAADAPALLLLHGFPTSSHMYRGLLDALADRFHLVAPDYPGFGNSDSPSPDRFAYTFDHLADVTERFLQACGLRRFGLYVQDYGAPVGFRIAAKHPEWIQAVIVQNGNAYQEGLTAAWEPMRALWRAWNPTAEAAVRSLLSREMTQFQYTHGVRDLARINPDGWNLAQAGLDRPGNDRIQLALLYDYRSNLEQYSKWQAYLRQHQPPTLIVWGTNDPFFSPEGARAFRRDLPNAELHLLDTGHFALEENGGVIAEPLRRFYDAHVSPAPASR